MRQEDRSESIIKAIRHHRCTDLERTEYEPSEVMVNLALVGEARELLRMTGISSVAWIFMKQLWEAKALMCET